MNRAWSDKIATLKLEVERDLRIRLQEHQPVCLYEPMRYSLQAGGKRLRPILLLLIGEGLGGDRSQLLPAAAAIEMLHTFTLIHDDIIDNDTQRRGHPTLHIRYDLKTGVLAGDGLFALALCTLMEATRSHPIRLVQDFCQAVLSVCEGQALDIDFERRLDVTPEAYLEMIALKTGELLSATARLGAAIAGASADRIEAAARFGRDLGCGFQIQDDLLELLSDQQTMGKSLTSDLEAGKKTYPVIRMLDQLAPETRAGWMAKIRQCRDSKESIIMEMDRYGIPVETRQLAADYLDRARTHISIFPPALQQELELLVEYISQRRS